MKKISFFCIILICVSLISCGAYQGEKATEFEESISDEFVAEILSDYKLVASEDYDKYIDDPESLIGSEICFIGFMLSDVEVIEESERESYTLRGIMSDSKKNEWSVILDYADIDETPDTQVYDILKSEIYVYCGFYIGIENDMPCIALLKCISYKNGDTMYSKLGSAYSYYKVAQTSQE